MKRDLLAYYQEVLDKISQADARTFRKEMRKAFKRLVPEEREQLKTWFRSACVCRVEQPVKGVLQPLAVKVRKNVS
ncbi:MAG: hypothetical protein JNL43_07280 [Flavobacteriales bacterium]|nr:hypothetical protein [Flavobacteriales bacterium]HRH71269.1 hypothetical protein [Flavobacteriales bacterium]